LLVTSQSLKAVGLWIELAEEAVERAVLKHQHDDVVDLLQLTHVVNLRAPRERQWRVVGRNSAPSTNPIYRKL